MVEYFKNKRNKKEKLKRNRIYNFVPLTEILNY